jgi:hypothetical protein
LESQDILDRQSEASSYSIGSQLYLILLAKSEKESLPWTEMLKSDLKVRLSDPLAIVISSILCKISSRAILPSQKMFLTTDLRDFSRSRSIFHCDMPSKSGAFGAFLHPVASIIVGYQSEI